MNKLISVEYNDSNKPMNTIKDIKNLIILNLVILPYSSYFNSPL